MLLSAVALFILFIQRLRWPPGTSVKDIIERRYNVSVLHTFRSLERTEVKYKKRAADLDFLKTCSENDLTPSFLNFKAYKPGLKSSRIYKATQKQFLQNEIKDKERELKQWDSTRKKLEQDLRHSVSFFDHIHLAHLADAASSGKVAGFITTHKKKLRKLGYKEPDFLSPDKVIFNYSSRVLTPIEKSVLSKGLKFVLPPKKLSLQKYLLTFEKFYYSLSQYPLFCRESQYEDSDTFKTDLRHLAFSSYKEFKKNIPKNSLTDEELAALKSLSEDKNIIISRPDKGNGVVLLDKSDYKEKMHTLLSDTSKFEKTNDTNLFRKITSEQDRIKRFISKFFGGFDSHGNRSKTYKDLYPTGTFLGVLYGLPKVHKVGAPLRPILSACNTPAYNIAKLLVPIISPLTKNIYTIPDSFKFAKEICNLNFEFETVMASFDVTSLFTNIPLNETINIIINDLFVNDTEYIDCVLKSNEEFRFNKAQFRELLEKACLDCHFTFDGTIYRQIDGVAMGSPLGPTLANAFMCHMEREWLSDCPLEFKPLFYRRYVDDTFLIFKSPTHINLFLTYLNSRHPNIKFTCDNEKNAQLPFLDLCIKRSNGEFLTSIYRKPTYTGLLSKYDSFSPILYKSNLVATLTYRAYKLSSNFINFHIDMTYITGVLRSNGYPLPFIDKTVKKTLNKLEKEETLNYDVPKPIVMFSTYFLGDASKRLSTKVTSLIERYYPQIRLRIVYKNLDTIGNRFKIKDSTPKDCMSCLVYKYTCESCNAFYIGKTEQHLRSRISQHMGVSDRTGASLSTPVHSDIRDHCLKHKQKINCDNFTVLDRTFFSSELCTLESLYQKSLKPNIGIHTQSTPLLMYP